MYFSRCFITQDAQLERIRGFGERKICSKLIFGQTEWQIQEREKIDVPPADRCIYFSVIWIGKYI